MFVRRVVNSSSVRLGLRMPKTIRNMSTIRSYLPDFKGVNGDTTLGEVFSRAYGQYKYRLAYPLVAWIGFLWYNLWVP